MCTAWTSILRTSWPDNIELLYYSFHLMITLGTLFIVLMSLCHFPETGGANSSRAPGLLWVLMLSFPFPYIANTLGWMTAELGRQPWLVYGFFRTKEGYSQMVSNGETIFTLIGFTGLYFVLGLLFLYLVGREIAHGPDDRSGGSCWPPNRGGAGTPMIATWYGVVSLMLIVYIVLDGRNFGAGMLYRIVAKTPLERRQVIAAIGPFVSWHEVWLVGFGGTLIAVFPRLLASAFSGYYFALFLILWCLILRGISLEVGGHIDDRLWQAFWDGVFAVASLFLAIIFGAAGGQSGPRSSARQPGQFFHGFFQRISGCAGNVGMLDWYTVSVAVFAVIILGAHGASYLTLKTEGPVHDRSAVWAKRLWVAAAPALVAISVESVAVRPDLPARAGSNPLCWLGLLVIAASTITLVSGLLARQELREFLGSNLLIAGLLMTAGAAIYPIMLYSTISPGNSLTADAVASSNHAMILATTWWPLGFALAIVYFVFVSRRYAGKVSVRRDNQGFY